MTTPNFNTLSFHNLSPPNRGSFGISLFVAAILGHIVFRAAVLFVACVEKVAGKRTSQLEFLGELGNMEAGTTQRLVRIFTDVDFSQFAVLFVDQENVTMVARAFRWFRFLK
jgi:hypothetical protein